MGCGAHVEELVRTSSGEFTLAQSRTLEALQALKGESGIREALLPMSDLLPHFPRVLVDDLTSRQIRQGRDFHVSPFRANPDAEYVKAIEPGGSVVAIGQIALPNIYHPVVVFSL